MFGVPLLHPPKPGVRAGRLPQALSQRLFIEENALQFTVVGQQVWGDEAEVRVCETALPRTEEECQPTVCGVCAGESVLDAEKTVASRTGLSPEAKVAAHERSTETAADQKNRIRTLASTWQNTYYLEDAGLFRGSLAGCGKMTARPSGLSRFRDFCD